LFVQFWRLKLCIVGLSERIKVFVGNGGRGNLWDKLGRRVPDNKGNIPQPV
jgi:hypothetical protein